MFPLDSSARIGSTVHVAQLDARCSDEASGKADRPFCSIGAAALKVTPGQTVLVAAGDYRERVIIHRSGTRRAPIAFVALPGANVSLSEGKNGFYLSDASWVSISGFTITGTTSYGISVFNASHITLFGNRVSRAGKQSPTASAAGIYLKGIRDSLVWRNVSFGNSYSGILLTYGATRNVVKDNVTYDNISGYVRKAPGIRLYASPDNTVTGNVSYGNEDSGIEMYAGSEGALVSNNVSYSNGDHGIDVFGSPGARVVGNTVHRNTASGINVEGGSSRSVIENNIAVDNGIDSPRSKGNIRVDLSSVDGTRMNFDLVYLTSPGQLDNPTYLVVWGVTSATSLHDLTSTTGQEARGIQADPAWAHAASGDYRLSSRSPAIDSADSSAPGQPLRDSKGHKRVDVPRTPNTGAGRYAYVDRGAFEFSPRIVG